jgi:plastocyanin
MSNCRSRVTNDRGGTRRLTDVTGSIALAVVLLLVACAPATDGDGQATASPAGGTVIEMTDDLRFDPEELTISVGDTVTWRNISSVDHTATDDPSKAQDPANAVLPDGAEPWDSGNIEPGAEWSYTFETPGEYTYFCIPHEAAGMVARITVVES